MTAVARTFARCLTIALTMASATATIAAPKDDVAIALASCIQDAQLQFTLQSSLCAGRGPSGYQPCMQIATYEFANAVNACGQKAASARTLTRPRISTLGTRTVAAR
jgi:hypothetical protein